MFQRLISEVEISRQAALLINTNNNLNSKIIPARILSNKKEYIIETTYHTVTACVKIERQSYNMSEIKHLVVKPSCRKLGLAKKLVSEGLKRSTTPIVYATVREDNIPSQKVFQSCGFINTGKYTTGNKVILIYSSTSPKWKSKLDNSYYRA